MSTCDSNVHAFPKEGRACSGKCRNACHAAAPRLWVIAACNGMVSLFKKVDHHLEAVPYQGGTIFPSLAALDEVIRHGVEQEAFDQLVVVGAGSDVAWLHMSLPPEASARIVAEMQYPLLPGWFSHAAELSHALEQIL